MYRLVLVPLISCAVSTARADIVYTLVPYSGFAPGWSFDGGTITTDGTLGPLTTSNIIDWEIGFTSTLDSYVLRPSNSTVFVSGNPVLTLSGSAIGITQTRSTTTSGGQSLTFSTTAPNQAVKRVNWDAGGTLTNPLIRLIDLDASGDVSSTALLSDANNVGVSAVPEAASPLLLAAGILAIAPFRRRRQNHGVD